MSERVNPVTVEMTEETQENAEVINPPKIKNVAVMIGGRKVPLRLTTRAVIRIEEEMDMDIAELQQKMNELRKKDTRTMIRALVILGNEGLRLSGETPDLTEDAVIDMIPAHNRVLYRVGVLAAISKGLFMETDNTSEEKQDVVLNEILKKNISSPGEGSGATA